MTFSQILTTQVLCSILAASLVQGVPYNQCRRFPSKEEAIAAYADALNRKIVRRIRFQVQPSGFLYVLYYIILINLWIQYALLSQRPSLRVLEPIIRHQGLGF